MKKKNPEKSAKYDTLKSKTEQEGHKLKEKIDEGAEAVHLNCKTIKVGETLQTY